VAAAPLELAQEAILHGNAEADGAQLQARRRRALALRQVVPRVALLCRGAAEHGQSGQPGHAQRRAGAQPRLQGVAPRMLHRIVGHFGLHFFLPVIDVVRDLYGVGSR
jgi:hypothetical protein